MTGFFRNYVLPLLAMAGAPWLAWAAAADPRPDCSSTPRVCVPSLHQLSVTALANRAYQSRFRLLAPVESDSSYAFMASYDSDGLRLYSRLDLPLSAAGSGFPLVALAPGWISREQAINWDFAADPSSTSGGVREALISRGFAVLTVGYRGRGTVHGVAAEGMEFRDAWGNGSYLSPIFYAVDLLNALAGLASLQQANWQQWLPGSGSAGPIDLARVSLWAHSQGGDVASTALAVIGAHKEFPQRLLAASIWSGNIPDRLTQANTFGPMGSALQAFMSGDGTWTGTATGKDGSINPEFVFGWPPDWIGTLEVGSEAWTWQAEIWSAPSVAEALRTKYSEMYDTLNRYVLDLSNLSFTIGRDSTGRSSIEHHPDVLQQMPAVGAFNNAQLINTPVALHVSDRDYYSIPAWNHELARRINGAGGSARVYLYPGTNHGLRKSKHGWYSPPGTMDGVQQALQRDARMFAGQGLSD